MADENETPQADADDKAEASPAPADETAASASGSEAAPASESAKEEAAPAAKKSETAPASGDSVEASEADASAAKSSETSGGEGAAPGKEGAAAGAETPKTPEKKKDIFAEIDPQGEDQPKVVKAKGSKNVNSGIVHVSATFNNTIVSVTDRQGNVLGWSSSGKMGFRGSRKSTAYASQLVSQDACRQAMSHGLKEVEVRVKGPGSGRESAVRAVQNLGIDVTVLKDVTPIPHNGCRPPKARRV